MPLSRACASTKRRAARSTRPSPISPRWQRIAAERASADEPAPVEELTADELERKTALAVPANRATLRNRLLAEGRRVPAWFAR